MWKIKYTDEAIKQLKKLPKIYRKKILLKLKELSYLERPNFHPRVRFLTGPLKKFFRLKVAKIRVIFQLVHKEKVIIVFTVLFRKDAYK
jgi:mRNA interferase RelE/StbE